MSLRPTIIDEVAAAAGREIAAATIGHCMRIDRLSAEDARGLCRAMRSQADPNLDVFILAHEESIADACIRPERAVEIRNRKNSRFCLIVPSGFTDAASSSLGNSFANFDLITAFTEVADRQSAAFPEELRNAVRQVGRVAHRSSYASPEAIADYAAAVAEQPTLLEAGTQLWRIGLLPDLGAEEFIGRLSRNAGTMRKLLRPSRAQASAAERVDSLGLEPGAARDGIRAFLEARRVYDAMAWLKELTDKPYLGHLSFENWRFRSDATSDLESINVAALTNSSGVVEKYTGLVQPEGAGTSPRAPIGPKQKVTVKFDPSPSNPKSVEKWQLTLIPSRAEYQAAETLVVDFPVSKLTASKRKGSVSLDLEAQDVTAVQVQVVALDKNGNEIGTTNGESIEGLSDEFWLEAEPAEASDLGAAPRRTSVATLPLARLQSAVDLPGSEIREASPLWDEGDPLHFAVTYNDRKVARLNITGAMRDIERHVLANVKHLGSYSSSLEVGERLAVSVLQALPLDELASFASFEAFLTKRNDIFRAIQKQTPRDLVATVQWSADLGRKVRGYADAYCELLYEAKRKDSFREVLNIDTLNLTLRRGASEQHASLVMPTHPLRLLWYSSYAELLGNWEADVLQQDRANRKRSIDFSLLERVSPTNFPAFGIDYNGEPNVFAQNLNFFWAVMVPATEGSASSIVSDCAEALGISADKVITTDLPPARFASEILTYHNAHPYVRALRLRVLNAGSGAFVADALETLLEPLADDDRIGERDSLKKFDILCEVRPPVGTCLKPLYRLQQAYYDGGDGAPSTHLSPKFSVTIRELNGKRDSGKPERVNVALAIDLIAPRLATIVPQASEDSASFYGLLMRMVTTFIKDEGGSTWFNSIQLKNDASREKHPTFGPYVSDLVGLQRAHVALVSQGIAQESSADGLIAATAVDLGPDEYMTLEKAHYDSDWVISLDRFLGPELYDDPSDPNLARLARKYLLDYSPEFMDGIGHRMLVTTSHRDEIEEILSRALRELGFAAVESSVGDVLAHLKTISGRLALRVLGDDGRAREAVSLGLLALYLRQRGELIDSILVPVDAHPELFGQFRTHMTVESGQRCDLLRIRFQRTRMLATMIEVKSRGSSIPPEDLMDRMVDQMSTTETVFRDLFFPKDRALRLDYVLQRARLANILRYYLRRGWRHGTISSTAKMQEIEDSITRLEAGAFELRSELRGYVVSLKSAAQAPIRWREADIEILTEESFRVVGLVSEPAGPKAPGLSAPTGRVDVKTARAESAAPAVAARTAETDAIDEQPAVVSVESGPKKSTERNADKIDSSRGEVQRPIRSDLGTGFLALKSSVIEVLLGHAVLDQAEIFWKPSVKGSPHMFILGIPGQGKSWTIKRILQELAKQGLPSLVIDFHGQYEDGEIGNAARLDASAGLPFSPFEARAERTSGANFWKTNSYSVAEIFHYVCDLGDIQRDIMYEAIRKAYECGGFTQSNDVPTTPTIHDVMKHLEVLEQTRGAKNVLARCRPLLDFGLFDDNGHHESFDELLKRGLIIDLHNLDLEATQLGAGAFILRKVYKEMFSWGETDRLRLAIVLDEAHRLTKDITLPKLMKEGRKFGISVVVASQGLADFHPDVVGNAGTKVVFRTNSPMSKKVAGFLRARKNTDLGASIEQLDVGQAYVQTPEMPYAKVVRMCPPDGVH